MNIKVIIATHKKYKMPKDALYLPVHVGREGKEELGYVGDNTGDNISLKNPSYCELTGLYWAWKNLDVDYLGLAHYRRHFTLKKYSQRKKWGLTGSVLTKKEAEVLLKKYKILVPKKRKYYIGVYIWICRISNALCIVMIVISSYGAVFLYCRFYICS